METRTGPCVQWKVDGASGRGRDLSHLLACPLALGPTQRLIKWIPGARYWGIKRVRCKVDLSPPCGADLKNEFSSASILRCFRAVFLNLCETAAR
jgi:hypothetical protein